MYSSSVGYYKKSIDTLDSLKTNFKHAFHSLADKIPVEKIRHPFSAKGNQEGMKNKEIQTLLVAKQGQPDLARSARKDYPLIWKATAGVAGLAAAVVLVRLYGVSSPLTNAHFPEMNKPLNSANDSFNESGPDFSEVAIKDALNSGAKIDVCNQNDYTPFVWASLSNDTVAVALSHEVAVSTALAVVEGCPSLPSKNSTEEINPSLYTWVKTDFEMDQRLIHAGAELIQPEGKGLALHDSVSFQIASQFAGNSRSTAQADPIKPDPKLIYPIGPSSERGGTPLHQACEDNDLNQVKSLVDAGNDVNMPDHNNWTPLIWASALNHGEVAQFLVDQGADVNARTKNGSVPLHWAAYNGNTDLMRSLLSKGADVNAVDEFGQSVLLSAAAYSMSPETVKLVLEASAQVNQKNLGGYSILDTVGCKLIWENPSNPDLIKIDSLLRKHGATHALRFDTIDSVSIFISRGIRFLKNLITRPFN